MSFEAFNRGYVLRDCELSFVPRNTQRARSCLTSVQHYLEPPSREHFLCLQKWPSRVESTAITPPTFLTLLRRAHEPHAQRMQ